MNKKTILWLKLLLIPGIGAATFYKIRSFFADIDEVFRSDKQTLLSLGLKQEIISYILNNSDDISRTLEKEIQRISQNKIDIFLYEDDKYPEHLKHIDTPPPILYIKGKLEDVDQLAVGIVGTRYPTIYGKEIAYKLGRELAENGVTVVSGLARGIDSAAHRGAIENGRSIGVLGTGLGLVYPPENKELFDQVCDKGALISELPFSIFPERFNFPLRNRIISGLSKGILVVEAGHKSGALITAKYALEQGKDVFAVPGEISNPRAKGPNSLIKEGAKIVADVNDIMEEIYSLTEFFNFKKEQDSVKMDNLDEKEKEIFKIITDKGKIHIDEIIQSIEMPVNNLMTYLGNLEIKGFVKQIPGKFYCNDI
ncbi:DNA-processing protein DprA [bacterium]